MTGPHIEPPTVEGFVDEWTRLGQSEIAGLLAAGALAKMAGKLGLPVDNMPLSAYRDCSFYVMRTDALDRFGTRLEQRFAQSQIRTLMEKAGLTCNEFSAQTPSWCAVGFAGAAPQDP